MKKVLVVFAFAGSWALQAHPGHGHDNPLSPGHYTGNAEHALPLAFALGASAILVGWGLLRWRRYLLKARNRR